jgi:hypothetical protein
VSYNLNEKELGEIHAVVRERSDEFKSAWNRHFTR